MWLLVSEREIISSRAEVFLEHLVKISLKKKKATKESRPQMSIFIKELRKAS